MLANLVDVHVSEDSQLRLRALLAYAVNWVPHGLLADLPLLDKEGTGS